MSGRDRVPEVGSEVDVEAYNRRAWDGQVDDGNRWTQPVSPEAVARARAGEIALVLTPERIVPRDWYGEIEGADCLCLASGGGQQAPILFSTWPVH